MLSSNTSQVADGGYQISRSLRFNSPDSADLRRTPASAGNRKTWTWSAWIKRGSFPANASLFGSAPAGTSYTWITLFSNNLVLENYDGALAGVLTTTAVFRDPSAWYHIVATWDSTQATSSNRIRLYVNGVQITAFNTASYPSQNLDSVLNNANQHAIGSLAASYTSGYYFDGYMAEVYFIDGQALTPSSFGETNAQTGVWQPKAYAGSYGTNGFYLNFSDNSNTTAATLGKDYSGNGNNWTPNNFSVAAGAGNDSLVDTPTPYGSDSGAGGEVRGNYCTLNPLTTNAGTYTQGNLRYVGDSNWRRSSGTTAVSTGKWYWEVTIGNAPNPTRNINSAWNTFGFGVPPLTVGTASNPINGLTDVLVYGDNGYANNFGTTSGDLGAISSGDVLSIAVDLDANSYTLRKNNSQVATGTIGGTAGRTLVPVVVSYNGDYGVMDCNFGQRPFAYTAPSGFQALCTQNLPTPTIGATAATQAGKYYNAVLYTGAGGSQSVTGVGFQPDFIWMKTRSNSGADAGHILQNAVTGVNRGLQSNTTGAEFNDSTTVTAFNTDGYTVGGNAQTNASGRTYVAWNWKANGSGSTNTSGTITSTVSVNTTSGFSVVTYTGNGVSGATVGHGLGVTPSMIILKSRTDGVYDWRVYHSALTAGYNIALNSTAQQYQGSTGNAGFISAVSSTTYTLTQSGADVLAAVNKNGDNYAAYCFAAVAGYSAFGSFNGNGATGTGGPFIYTGFRPAFVLIKKYAGQDDNWFIFDNKRDTYNVTQNWLLPNASNAETSDVYNKIDILSNGFAIRVANASFGLNVSGTSFIFMAFAESPFKYSLAR